MALYECYVDGAARGHGSDPDGGHGAAAVLIYKNSKLIGQYARAYGRASNNVAEYEAVLLALVMCWAADLRDPIIYSDSELVCRQVAGEWEANDDLRPLLLSVQEIQEDFRFRLVQVPRAHVAAADRLVNQLLDTLLGTKPRRRKRRKRRNNNKDG